MPTSDEVYETVVKLGGATGDVPVRLVARTLDAHSTNLALLCKQVMQLAYSDERLEVKQGGLIRLR